MHLKQFAILLALLGTASLAVNAAELTAKNSIQGRSGIKMVVRSEPQKPTIALSKQGQGLGKSGDQERAATVQWHNPSRQLLCPAVPSERD